MQVLISLFFVFVKIGFTSFGGMSMIPLILEEMQGHHWMSAEDMSNLIAIAEMTPGPLGINCATFAGTQTAGVVGGLVAVAGVLTPAFSLTLLTAVFFERFRKSSVMVRVLSVVKPICIAMILSVILELMGENYMEASAIDWKACGLGVVILFLILKCRWKVPQVIAVAALAGLLLWGI